MIELTPGPSPDAKEGDLYQVRARNATVFLQVLSNRAVMLIIEDPERHVYLKLTHKGRSPIKVWVFEEWEK